MCHAAVDRDDVRETARGVFELARPGNCIAAAVLTGTGAFVAGASDALAPAAIAAVTTAFAVAAGNAINDYFDRGSTRSTSPTARSTRRGLAAACARNLRRLVRGRRRARAGAPAAGARHRRCQPRRPRHLHDDDF